MQLHGASESGEPTNLVVQLARFSARKHVTCNMQEWLACKNGSAARPGARRPSPGGAPPLIAMIVSAGRLWHLIVSTVAVITTILVDERERRWHLFLY